MKEIYVLVTTSCYEGEVETDLDIFNTYEEAKKSMEKKIEDTRSCVERWNEWKEIKEDLSYLGYNKYSKFTESVLIKIYQREVE